MRSTKARHDIKAQGDAKALRETSIRSESVYEGALLHVYRDEVEVPGGHRSVREWIDHPGAAAVVPYFDDGSVVLIRQFRFPPRRTFLEVPAGKMDEPGEPAAETALRELEEETGWKAGRLVDLGVQFPCIGYSNERIHLFLALDLTKGAQSLEDGEALECVRVPFREAVEQAFRGELADMKTTTALLLAHGWLQQNNPYPANLREPEGD